MDIYLFIIVYLKRNELWNEKIDIFTRNKEEGVDVDGTAWFELGLGLVWWSWGNTTARDSQVPATYTSLQRWKLNQAKQNKTNQIKTILFFLTNEN